MATVLQGPQVFCAKAIYCIDNRTLCAHSEGMETKEHGYRDNAYTGSKNLAEQAREKVAESIAACEEYTRTHFNVVRNAILVAAGERRYYMKIRDLMGIKPPTHGDWCRKTLISLLREEGCHVGRGLYDCSDIVTWYSRPAKYLATDTY